MGKHKRPRNPERMAAIVARFEQARDMRAIATEFGVTRQAIHYILTKAGAKTSCRGDVDHLLPDIEARWRSGEPLTTIAKDLNISLWTIRNKFRTRRIRLTPSMSAEQRFWFHVDAKGTDDCWLWTKAVHIKSGHGMFSFHNKSWFAHRVAWYLTHGSVPEGGSGLVLLHKCGVAACCNPAHMRVGTRVDNGADHALHNQIGRGPHAVAYFP